MPAPTCTFCSDTAAFVPTDECRVCRACAPRIERLAAFATSEVWDAPPLARDEEMEALAKRVAKQLSPEDAEAHYNLAVAYREMGLHADAVRSAALALEHANDDAKTTAALRLLLSPPLLRPDGLAKLRARLKRMMSN